jgi:hypothetical protein
MPKWGEAAWRASDRAHDQMILTYRCLVFQPEAKGDVNVPYWTIDLAPDCPDGVTWKRADTLRLARFLPLTPSWHAATILGGL